MRSGECAICRKDVSQIIGKTVDYWHLELKQCAISQDNGSDDLRADERDVAQIDHATRAGGKIQMIKIGSRKENDSIADPHECPYV